MNIDEMHIKRHLLAERICQEIKAFEQETGLLVTDVELEKHSICKVGGQIITTLLEVRIEAHL